MPIKSSNAVRFYSRKSDYSVDTGPGFVGLFVEETFKKVKTVINSFNAK